MRLFLREAQKAERSAAAERLTYAWMAANLDGDAVKDAVRSIKGE
jgi:hypothetical protein